MTGELQSAPSYAWAAWPRTGGGVANSSGGQGGVPRLFPWVWAFVACIAVAGFGARLALWLGHGGARGLQGAAIAFGYGLRFDLVIGALLGLLLAALWLPLRVLRRPRWAQGTLRGAGTALLAAFVLAGLCEYFYYGFYKTRFDPVVFGLMEDDTRAVLATIWDGYPVLRMLAVLVLATAALAWLWTRLANLLGRAWPAPASRIAAAVLVIVQLLLLAGLARGSVGTFPLIRRDVAYSADGFVNAMVLNAPTELYKAARQRSKEIDIGTDPAAGLRALGFADARAAARAAGFGDGLDEDAIAARLFATAPGAPRPAAASPHVVLALLESFGADLLDTDGPRNDMLGRLRGELPKGYRFGNFIAGQNGTHPELEYLLLGSPITPLTQGANAGIAFDNSAALPFLKAGYHTAFVYGGGADWRNIGRTFARQGFERIYDARDIRQRYPQATGTDWGLYDQYLFDFVADLLQRADARGERLFVFVLSTTNHPPYALATPHAALPLDPTVLGARASSAPGELRRILATYQYQADQFGRFLQQLDAGGLGQRTVVAAAGDHNLRDHIHYDLPLEQPDVDRVFGYLRVPDALRPARPPDLQAIAGHGDLIPTLAALAAPGQRYFAGGRDLLAPAPDGGEAFATVQRLYLREGVLFPLDHPLLHRWQGPHRIEPAGLAPDPALLARARAATARLALRDWYIRREVIAARAAGMRATR